MWTYERMVNQILQTEWSLWAKMMDALTGIRKADLRHVIKAT